jgi:hypothetical protein
LRSAHGIIPFLGEMLDIVCVTMLFKKMKV